MKHVVLLGLVAACSTFGVGGGAEPDAGIEPVDPWECGGQCNCVASVSAGDTHACALRTNGTVSCWGQNSRGQVGDGTTTVRLEPVDVAGLTDVVQISAGREHTCATRRDGSVWCWGKNAEGELEDGTLIDRSAPVLAQLGGPTKEVVASDAFSCAIRENTTVQCWGRVGTQTGSGGEVLIAGVGALDGAVHLALGYRHSCALRSDDSVWCWGQNYNGEFGLATPVSAQLAVPSGFSRSSEIAAGGLQSCARTADGSVFCSGHTGLGADFFGDAPKLIGLASPAIAISSGQQHDCAIESSGRVACWGLGSTGRLGNGSNDHQRTPVYAGELTATAVDAARNFTCALATDGGVWCWGFNDTGQLGNGSTVTSSRPVATRIVCP